MTREHKLALIIGFSVFMVVGVLVGDYFSKARMARVDPALANSGGQAAQPVPAPVVPPTLPEEQQARIVHTMHRQPGIIIDMDDPKPPLSQLDEVSRLVDSSDGTALIEEPVKERTVPVTSNDKTYIVEAKDTLIKLARRNYGDETLWPKLRDYNKAALKGKDELILGMTLKLPTKDALLGRPAASPQVAPSTGRATPAAPRTYTVQKGETLGDIAVKTLGTFKRWNDLAKLNPTVNPNSMREGTVLKLPAK